MYLKERLVDNEKIFESLVCINDYLYDGCCVWWSVCNENWFS